MKLSGNASNNRDFVQQESVSCVTPLKKDLFVYPTVLEESSSGRFRKNQGSAKSKLLVANSMKGLLEQCLGVLSTANHPVSPINLCPHLLQLLSSSNKLTE